MRAYALAFSPELRDAHECLDIIDELGVAPVRAAVLRDRPETFIRGTRLETIWTEMGLPPGVFNLVDGDGAGVGTALASHPGIDLISFTGSTRAGIAVMRHAAEPERFDNPSSEVIAARAAEWVNRWTSVVLK